MLHDVLTWRASKACTLGPAEAESRDDVKADSCELAAAMRPSGCIDSDGVRCRGACGSTSSASGNAGAICFNSSAHASACFSNCWAAATADKRSHACAAGNLLLNICLNPLCHSTAWMAYDAWIEGDC